MMVDEAMPFYKLWVEIEKTFTSGDGYLDKLCMELVGLPSSRCRPPTRDVRAALPRALPAMMLATGVAAAWLRPEPMASAANMRDPGSRGQCRRSRCATSPPASRASAGPCLVRRGNPARAQDRARPIADGETIVRSACRSGRHAAIAKGVLVHVHNVASRYLDNDVDHYE